MRNELLDVLSRTSHFALRTWVLGAVLTGMVAGLSACAHIEPPSGGEEDVAPPVLIAVTPDSLVMTEPFRGPVIFTFDERLSEQGVDEAALVSPRTSEVRVGKSGDELRVSLGEGWEAGRIYQITIRPAIQDLWNNLIPEPLHLVFSTGPEIPDTRLTGNVTDLITGEPEIDARVEAVRVADSLVYAAVTDSAGDFTLTRIPEGEYRVRALRDLNRNRALDPFEPRDSAEVTVAEGDDPASVSFAIVLPDSTAPGIASASYTDGVVEVLFDDYLVPEQTFSPEQIRITGPGGETIVPERVSIGELEPRDTTVAADTVAPDTTVVDTTVADTAAPAAAPDTAAVDAVDTAAADTTAADTTAVDTARQQPEQLPSQTLAIEPAAPLAPETEYRITVEGVRNVVGLAGGGETTFTTPAAPPPEPADTVPPDTVPPGV